MIPLLMRGLERGGDLARDGERFVEGDEPLLDSISQGQTLNQLHYQRANAGGLFDAVDLRDVWMIERSQRFRFAFEARQALRVAGEHVRQDLQRNGPIKLDVARAIDLAHPAGANQGRYFVDAQGRAGNQGHRRR
jgi:hypothetical protein